MERNDDIAIGDLRRVINDILDFVENDLAIRSITPRYDHYWVVPDEDLYALDRQPGQLDAGSLKDDWHFLRAAVKNKNQALPATLAHVAPILTLLANQLHNHP
jgi:hypothetical protein